MSRYRPVAVSARDGFGHPLVIEVAAVLRHSVMILEPGGAVVGEAMADGIVYWDPPMSLRGGGRVGLGPPLSSRQRPPRSVGGRAWHRPLSPGGVSLQE